MLSVRLAVLLLLGTLVGCGLQVPTRAAQVDSLSLNRICAGTPAPAGSPDRTGLIAVHGTLLAHRALPAAWLPRRIQDVHVVACSEDGLQSLGSCGTYRSTEIFGPLATFQVSRLQAWQVIRIREARTGRVVASRTFWGGVPPRCPEFFVPDLDTDVRGTVPRGQIAFLDQWRQR